MKAATAKLLRAVIRLIEDDVREPADTVVEIDQREAAHYIERKGNAIALERRVAHLEFRLNTTPDASGYFSQRVALCAVPGCDIEGIHRHD